jgi:hypothetical protein
VSTCFQRNRIVADAKLKCFPQLLGYPLRIGLNLDYYRYFAGLKIVPGVARNEMLDRRVHFLIATALLHGIAHGAFRLQYFPSFDLHSAELTNSLHPKFPGHPVFSLKSRLQNPNWGYEFELALFGRIISPAFVPGVIPYYGLFAEKARTFIQSDAKVRGRSFQCVPMSWVEQWFSNEAIKRFDQQGLSEMRKMTDFWVTREFWSISCEDPVPGEELLQLPSWHPERGTPSNDSSGNNLKRTLPCCGSIPEINNLVYIGRRPSHSWVLAQHPPPAEMFCRSCGFRLKTNDVAEQASPSPVYLQMVIDEVENELEDDPLEPEPRLVYPDPEEMAPPSPYYV